MLLIALKAKNPQMQELHTATIYITGLVYRAIYSISFQTGNVCLDRWQLQFKEVEGITYFVLTTVFFQIRQPCVCEVP